MGIDELMKALSENITKIARLEDEGRQIRQALLEKMREHHVTHRENDSISVDVSKGSGKTHIILKDV